MVFESILPEIWISARAILLRKGEIGGLDPRAGERVSMRDSNRGRGEDDCPAELREDSNTADDKCRGTMPTRSQGVTAPPPSFPFLTHKGRATYARLLLHVNVRDQVQK